MRSFVFGGMLAALILGAMAPTGSAQAPPGTVPFELQLAPARGAPRATTAWERDGVLYLAADEMALLLDATLYWRSELGRVTLTADKHEIAVTAGSDVAVIDATQAFHLPGAVFFWGGELMVPLDLVLDESGAPRPWIGKPVRFSRERRRLSAVEREGQVIGAEITSDALGWRLHITADIDPRYEVVIAERSSVVIRLRGVSYDPLLLPLPTAHEAFQGLVLHNVSDGLEVSFTPTSDAQGYRVDVSGRRLSIVLGLDERDLREGRLRPLAAPAIAANDLRVVALDPGHGRGEQGAALAEGAEADLAMDLSQRIAGRIRQELGADIFLTREAGEDPSAAVRGQRAARGGADVFISVHLHDRKGGPAAFVADVGPEDALPASLTVLGFRSLNGGQSPYLASSRLLARSVMDGVAAALGEEPQGVFAEEIPELMSADQPAMLLELGVGDGSRRWSDEDREKVAAGVVEGLRLYLLGGQQRAFEEGWR
jgi:N-acetylmuramoyl-L-alanine amidase